jgi:hypothetical protein
MPDVQMRLPKDGGAQRAFTQSYNAFVASQKQVADAGFACLCVAAVSKLIPVAAKRRQPFIRLTSSASSAGPTALCRTCF